MSRIRVDLKLCDGCGLCVFSCPSFVLEVGERKVKVTNPDACLGIKAKQLCSECLETEEICIGCVACVRNCPTAALEIMNA